MAIRRGRAAQILIVAAVAVALAVVAQLVAIILGSQGQARRSDAAGLEVDAAAVIRVAGGLLAVIRAEVPAVGVLEIHLKGNGAAVLHAVAVRPDDRAVLDGGITARGGRAQLIDALAGVVAEGDFGITGAGAGAGAAAARGAVCAQRNGREVLLGGGGGDGYVGVMLCRAVRAEREEIIIGLCVVVVNGGCRGALV